MKKVLSTAAFTLVYFLEPTLSSAANIEILIFDENGKFAEGNHLEEGASFRREMMQAFLHLGKRLDSDETIKVAVRAQDVPNGSASASPRYRGAANKEVNGTPILLLDEPALDSIINGNTLPNCTPDIDVNIDVDKHYQYFAGFQLYSNSLVRGSFLHELGHGLGIVGNTQTIFGSMSNVIGNFDPPRSSVGADTVIDVLGRQVRLRESWGSQPQSHIGTGANYRLNFDGSVDSNFSNIFGEYENEDVMISVTSSGPRYHQSIHFTPIDMAILRDIGYPTTPLNAVFFYDPDIDEIGFDVMNVNSLYVPFLRVADSLLSVHLTWDGGEKFTLLGIPNDSRPIELLNWQSDASQKLNSPEAIFNASEGSLTIPNVEIYMDNTVQHFSMTLRIIPNTFPIKFVLESMTPAVTNGITPQITITNCD